MILRAFTDGASRGNPGESGIGVVVKNEEGETLLSLSGYIGRTTNNIAEYIALLTLLERMRSMSCSRLIVHSDSELMIRQLNGEYRVKNGELKTYHRKALKLRTSLQCDVEFRYVSREMNRDADRLANMGIDSGEPLPGVARTGQHNLFSQLKH